MKKITSIFLLCFSFFLFSCKPTEIRDPNAGSDRRSEIGYELLQIITDIYYNYPNHRTIGVHIKKVSSNFKDEPALGNYIYDFVRQYFEQASQCIVVPLNDSALDCIIEMHIINNLAENSKDPIDILSNILEPTNNTIIFSKKHHFNLNNLNYLEYRSSYVDKVDKIETSFLKVKAINIGSSYKEEDKYYINTVYGYWGLEETVWKKDTGFSSMYPAEQECKINGKKFNMNYDKIFYNDKILPGSVEVIASFRPGMWDAYRKNQHIGDKYQKKFYVILEENDNITVDIIFIYNDDKPDIKVKAYQIKQIKRGINIETINEIIEVFSE